MLNAIPSVASSQQQPQSSRLEWTSSTPASTAEQTTTESSSSSSKLNSEIKNHKSYFRRKVKTIPTRATASAITDNLHSKELNETSNDDENNLDYGLMAMSAAGDGAKSDEELTRASSAAGGKKDEKVKTLSDQIAEGKYGLIEKELFLTPPVRPGIISYKTNSETPNDNEKTLGGLKKEEIWLAEDHLLILKGGMNNEGNSNEDWKPIDDYEAPKRPVKIPQNPRVPPPFPVQLADNGPLQFIGHNQFSLFNPLTNETGLFKNAPGNHPAQAAGFNPPHPPARSGPLKNSAKDSIYDVIQPPPWLYYNNKENDILKQFPFNLPLPESVLNNTDEFDEDDPALFYPPPYSFVYKSNYTNLAPVGPLVPGIILPPPPDFFSVYDPDEDKKPVKTPIDVINRIKEIHLKNRLTAPSSTTSSPSSAYPSTAATPSTIRDYTKRIKLLTTLSPSSTPSTTRLHKQKSSTVRPVTTILQPSSTAPPPHDDQKTKITSFDTTTLKLYPVYTPTSGTTRIVSTTSSTLAPPTTYVKHYKQDYGTQHHPIYFEYFDARTANPIRDGSFLGGAEFQGSFDGSALYTPTVEVTTVSSPVYTSVDSTRAHHHHHHHHQSKKPKSYFQSQYISSTISPHPSHVDTKFLFVTPKPDIHYGAAVIAQPQYPVVTESPITYNAVSVQQQQKPLLLKPVRYEDEIAAIRHTLDYFKSGKKKKAPKVKAVYEFSFEAAKHKDDFQPMLSYDQQKYYSPGKQQQQQPEINLAQLSELINTNGYYPSTTETSMKYYRSKQSATLPPKKNSASASGTSAAPAMSSYGQQKHRQQPSQQQQQQQQPGQVNYYVRPIYSTKEVVSPPQSQKIVNYPVAYESHNQQQASPSDQGYRTNNRNTKYRKQQQQQQNTQQLHQQQFYGGSEIISLLNDTAVNYKQPQRPINPYAEFIDLSRYPGQQQQQQNSQHNSQHQQTQNSPPFYPPPQPPPISHPIYSNYPQRPFSSQQHYQQNPINVFKVYPPVPLPQLNPDSVHITFYNRPVEKSDVKYREWDKRMKEVRDGLESSKDFWLW